MSNPAITLESVDVVSEDLYARNGYPHEGWELLRREAPVYWYEHGVKVPFWAITKHQDIVWASRQPQHLLNAPRLAVFPQFAPPEEDERIARHLLNMDGPEHGTYRKLAAPHFTPRTIRRLEAAIEDISCGLLDELACDGSMAETDFVTSVAAPLPLAVLADLLGVPREDWELMFRWTNAIVGTQDPEYQLDKNALSSATEARQGLFEYFWKMSEERRLEPTVDIVSVLANARTNDEPIPPFELLSYFFLLVVAGNETTRNAMSGGLLALIENPHLAFGIGEHYCLGAHLARLELRVLFRQLAERLEHVELAGPVERLRSSFLGGVKHVPIRYRLRPSGSVGR